MAVRTLIQDDERRKLYDYTGRSDGQPVYVGIAHPGAKASETVWQIRKFTYDGDGNVTDASFANATSAYDKEWDERATYDYTPDS